MDNTNHGTSGASTNEDNQTDTRKSGPKVDRNDKAHASKPGSTKSDPTHSAGSGRTGTEKNPVNRNDAPSEEDDGDEMLSSAGKGEARSASTTDTNGRTGTGKENATPPQPQKASEAHKPRH